MPHAFDSEDAGKSVVTARGDRIGTVERVEQGRAFIKPEAKLTASFGSWLSSPWGGEELFPLNELEVVGVDGDSIVVGAAEGTTRFEVDGPAPDPVD